MEFEIFTTGAHTASNGSSRNYTTDDLDHIIASYNPAIHEAPIVIGHPESNTPAYGWVESLYRNGNVLFAKAKQLVPEFVELVKNGLFKKRSISLNPDCTLNHIGFLGAAAPAVKGLKDIQFSDAADFSNYSFDFSQVDNSDQLPELASQNVSAMNISDSLEVDPAQKENSALLNNNHSEKFVELQSSIDALKLQFTSLAQNFSGKLEQKEYDKVINQLDELHFSKSVLDFEILLNEKLLYGSFTPAMKEKIIAILNYFSKNNYSSFSYRDFTSQLNSLLIDFVNSVPKVILFESFATAPDSFSIKNDFYSSMNVDKASYELHKKALSLSSKENITYQSAILKLSS